MTKDEESDYHLAIGCANTALGDMSRGGLTSREAYLLLKQRHHKLTAIPHDERSGHANQRIADFAKAIKVLKPYAKPAADPQVREYINGVEQRAGGTVGMLTRRQACALAKTKYESLQSFPRSKEKAADVRDRSYYRKAFEVLFEETYTVEVIGREEDEGEKGTIFVLQADTLMHAIEKASDLFLEGRYMPDEHPYCKVLSATPGVPPADAKYHWNDYREDE